MHDDQLGDVEITAPEVVDPNSFSPWYDQLLKLDNEKDRVRIYNWTMKQLEKQKPEAARFIRDNNCILVGFMPKVEYTLIKESDGELRAMWSHDFSIATPLFWSKKKKCGIFTNALLDFNDTVLNKIRGNPKQRLHGFTG